MYNFPKHRNGFYKFKWREKEKWGSWSRLGVCEGREEGGDNVSPDIVTFAGQNPGSGTFLPAGNLSHCFLKMPRNRLESRLENCRHGKDKAKMQNKTEMLFNLHCSKIALVVNFFFSLPEYKPDLNISSFVCVFNIWLRHPLCSDNDTSEGHQFISLVSTDEGC